MRNFDPSAARGAREAKRLSQEAVAEQLGMQRTNYVLVEKGKRGLGARALHRLADLLDVPPEELTTTARSEATLRDLREWAGLTQAEVAAKLGIAPSWYGTAENGQRELTEVETAQLSKVLVVTERRVRQAWARRVSR